MRTTVGRLAIESILPKGYLDDHPADKPLGHKDIENLLQRVAEDKPELYKDVSSKLLRLGAKASVETGSSFSLSDLAWPVEKSSIMDKVDEEERKIFFDPKLSEVEKENKLISLYSKYSDMMPDISFDKGILNGSNLAKMVASGARGNKSQLNSNVGADFLVVDQNKKPVPIGIKHSFAEGLSLPEYFAGGYGARSGTIDGKFAVRDSGFLAKQLGAVSMDLLVTDSNCSTKNGIPVATSDKDNIGGVLARDANGYKAGTVITPKIYRDMQSGKADQIVLRSPITCEAEHGGICSHCAGVREKNRLPSIGENIGLSAASSFSEPLSQALLKSKHTAGVSNAAGVTGFKAINAMFQVPDIYPNKATLASADGIVEKVEELPQGGNNVYVNGVAHFVPPNMNLIAKVGSTLEAGDAISEGSINPAEITALKGIGQGRLNFIKDIKNIFSDNGVSINRRNAEVVAKASIDHIQVNDIEETSSYLPEDVVRYGNFSKSYQPRENSYNSTPSQSIGKFLEKPVLHYTIGTRITNSVAKNLDKFGDKDILVNDEEPSFSSRMVRLMDAPSHNEDWMAQLGTSYVQKNLKKNVTEGTSFSDIHGTHPLPALAYGKEFGKPPVGTVGY
jgi:DNA-directed RNA polymerase subunit beta'